MNLNGKHIVCVGGFSGIVMAICKLLMKRNVANIVLLARSEQKKILSQLQHINPAVHVHYINFDVLFTTTQITEIFNEIMQKYIPKIDLLINGAAIFNDHDADLTVRTNLLGLINTTTIALKFMDKRNMNGTVEGGGQILNISSIAGLNPFPTVPIYSSTKAGIIAFTISLSQLETLTGVSCIVICPGLTRTKMITSMPTFLNIDPNLTAKTARVNMQSADECALLTIQIIEQNLNGSIWTINDGELKCVPLEKHWQVPKELLE